MTDERKTLRQLAKTLAQDDVAVSKARAAATRALADAGCSKGRVLAALLRSPLVGSAIESERLSIEPRKIDL